MSPTTTLSLERERAVYAWREVSDWREQAWLLEAVQRTQGLPVELRGQGLMVVLAKLLQRDKAGEIRLADLLARWLLHDAPLRFLPVSLGSERPAYRLLATCRAASRAAYRAAQAESLALVEVVKLLSVARYGADDGRTAREASPRSVTSEDGSKSGPQARYAYAFEQVLAWTPAERPIATVRARSLPVEIHTQGLLVALANLMRDGRPGHLALANLLAGWLLERAPKVLAVTEQTDTKATTLLGACTRVGRVGYQAAKAEALALLDGVKTYADALYAPPDDLSVEGTDRGH